MNLRAALAELPPKVRAEARAWHRRFSSVARSKRGPVRSLKRLSRKLGMPYGTLRGRYYASRAQGPIGALDRRKLGSRYWSKASRWFEFTPCEKALIARYARRHPQSFSAAMHALCRDIEKGKVKVRRPIDPGTGRPRGYSIETLRRTARKIIIFRGRGFSVSATGNINPKLAADASR